MVRGTWRTAVLFLFLGALPVVLAGGGAPDRAERGDYVAGEVLLKFKAGVGAGTIASVRSKAGANEVRRFTGSGVRRWRLGRGRGVAQAVRALSRNPNVLFAEPNYLVRAHDFPDDPRLDELWGLHNAGQNGGTVDADIDAPEAWDLETGSSSVVVAVIDSGVDLDHEDLAANVWTNSGEIAGNGLDDDGNGYVDDVHGYDFVNDDADPDDDYGHGTHVSGTVGAVGNNGKGVVGVSRDVSIMALKFLGAGGSGSNADAIEAIEYAASFKDSAGDPVVKVINASWGGGHRSKAMEAAIANSGILFVASAGNSGNSRKMYPGAYGTSNMITVAATDSDDALASFSTYSSSWVQLAAPGVDTLSCLPGDRYGRKSGTSMAAPHVAGTAALVFARFDSSVSDVRSRILDNVDAISGLSGVVSTGGRLNALKALGGSDGGTTDTTAPSAVTNLSASNPGARSIDLAWTATGDDGTTGTAFLYDIRYRTDGVVTSSNWDTAKQVANEPSPAAAGTAESFALEGLEPQTTYYLAMRVADEAGNVSGISNGASATTTALPEGAWLSELVASDGGFYKGIAFDANGYPAIAYSGQGDTVRFAKWDGSQWNLETVASEKVAGPGVDLAYSPSGNPCVSYGWGKLRYAEKSGGSWSIVTVDNGARNDYTSLVFDPDGNPAICYRASEKGKSVVKLARRVNGTWTTEVVDTNGAGRYSSLAFDGNGLPGIAYSADPDDDGWISALKYAKWNGSSWSIETVEEGVVGYGVYASLDFHPTTDRPTIVHRTEGVRVLTWDGTAWDLEIVDAGSETTFLFASDGTPTIVYTRINEQGKPEVRVASHDGTAWDLEIVDQSGSARPDLAFAPNGDAGVTFGGPSNLYFGRRK